MFSDSTAFRVELIRNTCNALPTIRTMMLPIGFAVRMIRRMKLLRFRRQATPALAFNFGDGFVYGIVRVGFEFVPIAAFVAYDKP